MRKKVLFTSVLVAMMAMVFAGCSKSEDDSGSNVPQTDSKMVGTYAVLNESTKEIDALLSLGEQSALIFNEVGWHVGVVEVSASKIIINNARKCVIHSMDENYYIKGQYVNGEPMTFVYNYTRNGNDLILTGKNYATPEKQVNYYMKKLSNKCKFMIIGIN